MMRRGGGLAPGPGINYDRIIREVLRRIGRIGDGFSLAAHDLAEHHSLIASELVSAATSLTDDTAATLNTWEAWGGETLTLPLVGTFDVFAYLTGHAVASVASNLRVASRIAFNVDSAGFTSTSAASTQSSVHSTNNPRSALASQHWLLSQAFTTNLVVRGELDHISGGAAGNATFASGLLTVIALPA